MEQTKKKLIIQGLIISLICFIYTLVTQILIKYFTISYIKYITLIFSWLVFVGGLMVLGIVIYLFLHKEGGNNE